MPVDKTLLEILACPCCKRPVREEGEALVCEECHRRYPIRDGIPVMLIEEAQLPSSLPSENAEDKKNLFPPPPSSS